MRMQTAKLVYIMVFIKGITDPLIQRCPLYPGLWAPVLTPSTQGFDLHQYFMSFVWEKAVDIIPSFVSIWPHLKYMDNVIAGMSDCCLPQTICYWRCWTELVTQL